MDMVPLQVRISYDLLKELLHLPDDVKVLGIHGVEDLDGSFPLLLETPARHIKRDKMVIRYRQDTSAGAMLSGVGGVTTFDGFE